MKRACILLLASCALARSYSAHADALLWNNGPLVNAPFAGSGGAHDSRVQTELGLSTVAFAGRLSTPSSPADAEVADDFFVDAPGGWRISSITVYTVPFVAGTSTATSLRVTSTPPWDSGPVFSSAEAGVFSGIYRVPGDQPLDTSLPITALTVPMDLVLAPGHYWVTWGAGSIIGGFGFTPRVPPVTINGQTTTGNGRVGFVFCDILMGTCGEAWQDAVDLGTGTPQGFPFVIRGRPAAVRKGDFDGQHGPDLLFRNVNAASADFNRNKVWFMSGTIRLGETFVTPDPPGSTWSIAASDDFDTAGAPWNEPDGKPDLLFYDATSGDVSLWLMNGAARGGAPMPIAGASLPSLDWKIAATADFNQDAHPDIVWRSFSSQEIEVWTMNGSVRTGVVVPVPDHAVDANWNVVAAQDYNGDFLTDFLWYNATSGKVVTWYMNAALQRTSGQFVNPPNAGDNNWKVLASADYSGALVPLATPDIVWRNETSGRTVVWHLDFTSTRLVGEFTTPDANTPALDWTIVGPR